MGAYSALRPAPRGENTPSRQFLRYRVRWPMRGELRCGHCSLRENARYGVFSAAQGGWWRVVAIALLRATDERDSLKIFYILGVSGRSNTRRRYRLPSS